MANKGDANCCCGGCNTVPVDRLLATAAIQPIQQLCCACIPLYVCIRYTEDDYGEGISKHTGVECITVSGYDDPIFYSIDANVNGESVVINIRLSVDEEYETCYIVADINNENISDSVLINDYFCENFEADFELDVSGFGNGETQILNVHLSPADNINLKTRVKCANCSCVCRCACVTIVPLLGDGRELTTSQVCAETDTENHSVSWSLGDYNIVLGGNPIAEVIDFTLENGTETGTYYNTEEKDGVVHQIEPDEDGITSGYYEINTGTSEPIIELRWWGYVQSKNSEIEFFAWNWSSSYWESIGTQTGRNSSTLVVPNYMTLEQEHLGGTDGKFIRIRVRSEDSASIFTDYITTKSSNCCTLAVYDTYSGYLISDEKEIGKNDECPDLSKSWALSDGTTIIFECVNCGQCGNVATTCCPDNPLPRLLVASVTTDCSGGTGCEEFEIAISYGEAAGIWENEIDSPCDYQLVLSCSGSGWTVGGTMGPCTINSSTLVSESCNPFRLEFEINYIGIGCCGDSDPNSKTATVIITE